DFVGQRQKGRVEVASDDGRVFIKIGDQLQEFPILMDLSPCGLGVSGDFFLDFFTTNGGADDHAVRSKFLFIIGEGYNAKLAFGKKPVSLRRVTSGDAGKGKL